MGERAGERRPISSIRMSRHRPHAGWTAAAWRIRVVAMAEPMDRSLEDDVAQDTGWLDWVVALGPVAGLILLGILTADGSRSASLAATLVLVVIPLSVRRLFPLPVLLVVATGAVLTSVGSPVVWVEVCAVGLASFTVGERALDRTRSGTRRSWP